MKFLFFVAACVAGVFLFRSLTGGGGETSPYFSDRGAAAENPPAFLTQSDEGGNAPQPQKASKNLRFDLGVEETHIIAVGFHESAGTRSNVAHFDPVSIKPLSYPIEYDGKRWRYERILADDEIPIEFDTDPSGKVVALKDEDASRFQSRRLFRVLLASTLKSRLEDAWLVDRKSNQLVSRMPKGSDVVRGAGVTKVDFFLRNWHAAEWNLYCDFSTFDVSKPRDERRSTKPIRVKFGLPRYKMFDVSDGEENLFEVEIPFYRPAASLEKAGYGMTSQAQYYKEGKVPLGRVLEDVAQMVMYEVAEDVRGENLQGIEPDSYEDKTPYQILLEACRSAGFEPVIDDEARTISAVES